MTRETIPMPSEIFTVGKSKVAAVMSDMPSSADIFDDDAYVSVAHVPGYQSYQYIPFGYDNQLPFEIIRLIGSDEIMSQNKYFNVLTCYGNGLRYNDPKTDSETTDPEIKR